MRSYEDAEPEAHANHWSSTENSGNNAWNCNFSSGNFNNNNKNNNLTVRPVAALDGFQDGFPLFLESVVEAYRKCMKGKMRSAQALEYMARADSDLPEIAREMWEGRYVPSTSTCFLVTYPKLREIFAANFRDRIVHHWICMRLEPLFEERFRSQGDVSFNCRKGYGTINAQQAVARGMEKVSDNYRKPAWVFKGDRVSFFMSIPKARLRELLGKFIRRKYRGSDRDILMRVTETTVMHNPEKDCVLNSDPRRWRGLARNKSLFTCGDDRGEPIGNHTTQQFANFYLSFFDAFVAFLFRRENYAYVRFVDDFVIICDDPRRITSNLPEMERYLRQVLGLELHRDKRYIQPVSHGVKMVGAVIKPRRMYTTGRTIGKFLDHANGYGRMFAEGETSLSAILRTEQVLNSYLGILCHHRTYNVIDSFRRGAPDLWKYLFLRRREGVWTVRAKVRFRFA